MQQRIVFSALVSLIAMSVTVSLVSCQTKSLQTGSQTKTGAADKDAPFETSLGTLTRKNTLLRGNLVEVAPGKLAVTLGFICIDSKNAFPIKEPIKVYMGDKPDHPTVITLVQDLKSDKWLATDGCICYKHPKYMLLDGDTVKIIGGEDNPVYIGNQPFADTTVYLRNGKPQLRVE